MAETNHTERNELSSPDAPTGTPADLLGRDYHNHSSVLQAVMEMQKSLGELIADVKRLREDTLEHKKKLDSQGDKLTWIRAFAAGAVAVLMIVGGVIFYIGDKFLSQLPNYLAAIIQAIE